jgi:C4-dicarboxylate-specific signal transduction histidine kinase
LTNVEKGRGRFSGVARPLVLSGLHLILVWSIAIGLVWASYQDDVDDWKMTARNTSLATAAYVQQALNAADLVLKSMKDWIADEDIGSEEQFRQVMSQRRFFEVMSDRIVGMPQIGIAGIVARNGDLINNSAAFPSREVNIAEREPIKSQLVDKPPDVSLSALLRSTTNGRWAFYLSRQVRSKSGEVLGVICIGLDSAYFSRLFGRLSLGDGGAISLFRDDGTLLATTLDKPGLLGQRYPNSAAEQVLHEGSGTVDSTTVPPWSESDRTGKRLVAPRRVDGFPVFVAVSIGEETYLHAWHRKVMLILAVAAFLTAITVYVGARIVRLTLKTQKADRVSAEQRLLATVIDTPSALCAVIDRQGRLLFSNERFRSVVGPETEAAAIFGSPHIGGGDAVLAFAASDEHRSIELDLRSAHPGERVRDLHFSVSRQSLPDLGDCTILVGHDETERHQAQRVIAQSAKMVMLGEMTTGMAHELSQPLNVVRMAAQNALAEIDPADGGSADPEGFEPMTEAEFHKFIAGKFTRIVAQVDRAADIISRMRIFGRASDAPAATFDVRDACNSALALVGPRIRSMGIAVREDLGSHALTMLGQRGLLEQVIVNLLMNARDALKDAPRADKQIEVTTRPAPDGHITIDVADNGPGVPLAIRDRIFEPFFTAKPTGQGTGLGLALSFGIVRDAGGLLSLVPSESGATFRIDLPAASGASTARPSVLAALPSP